MNSRPTIKSDVADYYTSKLKEYGPSPKGVDWNSEQSQELRFKQLCKLFAESTAQDSLLDYGCGYGALFAYLKARHSNLRYTGFDIAPAMLVEAQTMHPAATWTAELNDDAVFDYVVASGIFNVKMERSDAEWQDYILSTIDEMNCRSTKGFSFNVLTSYSDADRMQSYLYYADPARIFDYCKRTCSRFVALIHDYPLYEFTVLVRKDV